MRVEKKSYSQISLRAKLNGEDISMMALSRHFRFHWTPLLEALEKSDEVLEETVQKRIQEKLNTLDEIEKIITICKSKVQGLLDEELSVDNIKGLNLLLTQIRKNLEFLHKIAKEIRIEPVRSREDVLNDVIYICQDLPMEYLEKIEKRMEELNKNV